MDTQKKSKVLHALMWLGLFGFVAQAVIIGNQQKNNIANLILLITTPVVLCVTCGWSYLWGRNYTVLRCIGTLVATAAYIFSHAFTLHKLSGPSLWVSAAALFSPGLASIALSFWAAYTSRTLLKVF